MKPTTTFSSLSIARNAEKGEHLSSTMRPSTGVGRLVGVPIPLPNKHKPSWTVAVLSIVDSVLIIARRVVWPYSKSRRRAI